MAVIQIDTTHAEASISTATDKELEVQIDGISVTPSSSLTLLEIEGATILQATNLYVRASGGTYDITLPAATGTLNTIQIKNLTEGQKTIKPSGDDLIDYTTTKAMSINSAAIFLDAGVGLWDIN